MSTGADETVLIDKCEGYAIVTLNDPDRRNVFTLAMSARVQELFDELEEDPGMNAVIITGAGKGFCSGGHLDELLDAAEEMAERAARAPKELLMRTKDTIHNTIAISDSAAAIDNELDTQVWSMGQPAFVDMVSSLKSRISGKG